MKILNNIIPVLLFLCLLNPVLKAQSKGAVTDYSGTLGTKSSFEPTKISVEEVNYIGANYITGADSVIMRNCAAILRNDLDFSPYFEVVLPDTFFMHHMEMPEMTLQGWKWLGAAYVVKLEAEFPRENLRLRYRLLSADNGREIKKEKFEGNKSDYRTLVHQIANDIVKLLTGDDGIYRCKIVYVRQAGSLKELYLADYDGFDERRLTNNKAINISPAFTPDGENIYFTSFLDENPRIYMLTLKNNNIDLIAGYHGINAAPAVSPDGKSVACVLSKDGNSEIYLLDRKGKIIKRLTDSWAIESSPTWSPDGREIAFTSDRTGSPQIYIMDADGLNVRRLTYEGKYNDSPCWSPRGDRIIYVGREKIFKICSVNINGEDLRILADQGDNENPHFSPDGNHIIFASNRTGQWDLYMMDLFGRNQRRLTTKGGYSNPIWSPIEK
jgi:TolB protein